MRILRRDYFTERSGIITGVVDALFIIIIGNDNSRFIGFDIYDEGQYLFVDYDLEYLHPLLYLSCFLSHSYSLSSLSIHFDTLSILFYPSILIYLSISYLDLLSNALLFYLYLSTYQSIDQSILILLFV